MSIEELHQLWEEKNRIDSVPRTSRRRCGSPEHDLQTACVNWFRFKYPWALIFSVPNGGYRGDPNKMVNRYMNQAQAVTNKLKEEGLVIGIPDLCIPVPVGKYHALYIEMKNGKAGRLSEDQKKRIAQLRGYGNGVLVCRTSQQFMDEVSRYMEGTFVDECI